MFFLRDIRACSDCTATIARMNTVSSQFTDQLRQVPDQLGSHVIPSHSPSSIPTMKAHSKLDPTRMANLTQHDKAVLTQSQVTPQIALLTMHLMH